MTRYKPNFVRRPSGNKLPHGKDLIIKVEGATIVTGILRKRKFLRWKVIQIEQSGHKNNPLIDQIKFEMVTYDKETGELIPMPKGSFRVTTLFHDPKTPGDSTSYNDKFEIE